MGLRGQGSRWNDERGYAMAALLIALAIMAILMSVALPVWRQEARREKEAELVFRGEQYARAIALYNYKNGVNANAFPPSIDVLVQGRFLRKKYKDPMTKDGEFMLIPLGTSAAGIQGGQGAEQPGGRANPPGLGGRSDPPPPFGGRGTPQSLGGGSTPPSFGGRGNPPPLGGLGSPPSMGGTGNPPPLGSRGTPPQIPQQSGRPPSAFGQQVAGGGIVGVRSKSQENSLRSYRGQTRYDQWLFVYSNAARPGGTAPGANTGDGRGNQPGLNQPGGNRGRGGTPPPQFNFPGRGGSPSGAGSGGRRGNAPSGRGPG